MAEQLLFDCDYFEFSCETGRVAVVDGVSFDGFVTVAFTNDTKSAHLFTLPLFTSPLFFPFRITLL